MAADQDGQSESQPNLAIRAEVEVMRGEALRRAVLVCMIAIVIPSLILSGSWPSELSDLVLPIGGPVTHIVHALGLCCVAVSLLVAIKEIRAWRAVRSDRAVAKPAENAAAKMAKALRVNARSSGFGGIGATGIEAVMYGRQRIVRMSTAWERKSITEPDAFNFAVAHEMVHLASGDPRVDRVIAASITVGGLLIVASIGRVIVTVVGRALDFTHIDLPTLWFVLKTSFPAVATNLVAFGTLAAALTIESRSSRRLREFHADAIAAAVSGTGSVLAPPRQAARSIAFIDDILADHPKQELRAAAVARAGVAFHVDQILFVLLGYFSATILEIVLQLMFVMASPNFPTLQERRDHLASMLNSHPGTIVAIIAIAGGMIAFSQSVVLARFRMMSVDLGAFRKLSDLALRLVC